MTNSPLGQYAPLVAALVCAGSIGVYLVALVFSAALGVAPDALAQLHDLAILAFGAVVGSAVAVNGWKAPLSSVHSRVDSLEATTTELAAAAGLSPAIANTHAAAPSDVGGV